MSLSDILQDLRFLRYRKTDHARKRMYERGVTDDDIQCVGGNAHTSKQVNADKWEVSGHDCDGDPLTLVVVFDGDTLIITVIGD